MKRNPSAVLRKPRSRRCCDCLPARRKVRRIRPLPADAVNPLHRVQLATTQYCNFRGPAKVPQVALPRPEHKRTHTARRPRGHTLFPPAAPGRAVSGCTEATRGLAQSAKLRLAGPGPSAVRLSRPTTATERRRQPGKASQKIEPAAGRLVFCRGTNWPRGSRARFER